MKDKGGMASGILVATARFVVALVILGAVALALYFFA